MEQSEGPYSCSGQGGWRLWFPGRWINGLYNREKGEGMARPYLLAAVVSGAGMA